MKLNLALIVFGISSAASGAANADAVYHQQFGWKDVASGTIEIINSGDNVVIENVDMALLGAHINGQQNVGPPGCHDGVIDAPTTFVPPWTSYRVDACTSGIVCEGGQRYIYISSAGWYISSTFGEKLKLHDVIPDNTRIGLGGSC